MRNIKQVREENIIVENNDSESRKLTTLIRAGLFDAKKLPMLKRALEKDASKLNPQERSALLALLDSLMDQVIHSSQVYSKVKQNVSRKEVNESTEDYFTKLDPRTKPGYDDKTDKQIPTIIMLKRKAIRNYPDNQKVALYYAQALDKYIVIPFGREGDSGPAVVKEETVNEISQELAKDAYLRRLAQTKSGDDSPEGASNRAIAGLKSTKTLKRIGRKFGETQKVGTKAAGSQVLKNIEGIQKRAADRKNSLTEPVSADWSGVGQLIGRAIRAPVQGIGGAIRDKVAMRKVFKEENDIKLRFRQKLYEKRTQQIDEVGPAALLGLQGLAALGRVATVAGPAIGRGIVGGARTIGRGIAGGARAIGRTIKKGVGAGALAAAALSGGSAPEATKPINFNVKAKGDEYEFNDKLAGAQLKGPGEKTATFGMNTPTTQVKMNKALYGGVTEELKNMVKNNISEQTITINEVSIDINNNIAEKIMSVHKSLNAQNRAQYESMLNESVGSFKKAVNFALRY